MNNFTAAGFTQILQLSDKNFITCGAWSDSIGISNSYLQGFLVKFDLYGNIIWSKKYFKKDIETFLYWIVESKSGDLVICGGAYFDQSFTKYYKYNPLLLKVDKNGNILMQKIIGHIANQGYEYPMSLEATSDKGFLISTYFYGMKNPTPYSIIKVDSTFCDSTEAWCREVALGVEDLGTKDIGFRVYPNPAKEQINISITNQYAEKPRLISIVDILGKEVIKTQILNDDKATLSTNDLETGIYFVRIIENGVAIETQKLFIQR
jgi:hypothetical protein